MPRGYENQAVQNDFDNGESVKLNCHCFRSVKARTPEDLAV